ncbi:hypothetical protein JQS43_18365 [Natronosporangium hydrolyticum]|uniref:Uncharacterized protein n=1 Tax=Natronosporangium hydrolyticum TaxID=2811111 RepID=A0A895YDR6_9ACTN|nr:hypothetical protein [Natronosporangium hydrolyticum]QSB13539.1 hypothetical protein JQS43_18365 [Natronosporangium hydrolyticum]
MRALLTVGVPAAARRAVLGAAPPDAAEQAGGMAAPPGTAVRNGRRVVAPSGRVVAPGGRRVVGRAGRPAVASGGHPAVGRAGRPEGRSGSALVGHRPGTGLVVGRPAVDLPPAGAVRRPAGRQPAPAPEAGQPLAVAAHPDRAGGASARGRGAAAHHRPDPGPVVGQGHGDRPAVGSGVAGRVAAPVPPPGGRARGDKARAEAAPDRAGTRPPHLVVALGGAVGRGVRGIRGNGRGVAVAGPLRIGRGPLNRVGTDQVGVSRAGVSLEGVSRAAGRRPGDRAGTVGAVQPAAAPIGGAGRSGGAAERPGRVAAPAIAGPAQVDRTPASRVAGGRPAAVSGASAGPGPLISLVWHRGVRSCAGVGHRRGR